MVWKEGVEDVQWRWGSWGHQACFDSAGIRCFVELEELELEQLGRWGRVVDRLEERPVKRVVVSYVFPSKPAILHQRRIVLTVRQLRLGQISAC